MKKTLLFPTATQYGLLDELAARAARYASTHLESIPHRVYDYDGAKHGRYFFSTIWIAPCVRLEFGRKQGVFGLGRQRIADRAALKSVRILEPAVTSREQTVELTLDSAFENISYRSGADNFRLLSRDGSPVPRLHELPELLTLDGPEDYEKDRDRLRFVVTSEVTYAFSLALSRIIDQVEKGVKSPFEPLSSINVHKQAIHIHPGLTGANPEITNANICN